MTSKSDPLYRKLCQILHWGFVEARRLARVENHEQGCDLADAFELIPSHMSDWNEESLGLIRSTLHQYQEKYGASPFDYLAVLNLDDKEFMDNLERESLIPW